jgi:chromate reductase, NAD(P)H dehydrogenase (quinone)
VEIGDGMAEKLNVLSICGSLRKGSFNAIVERALPGLAPAGMIITPAPPYRQFPIYNFDVQHDQGIPADVTLLGNAILAADGVVIVTPEYNFSIPGGLKNAIDWLSRMKEPSPFAGKPFAIQSATNGSVGGARMQYHLRQVLNGLNAFVLNSPEIFIGNAKSKVDEAKRELTDETTRDFIRKQLAAFAGLIERVRRRG